jgi:hypothetical protein
MFSGLPPELPDAAELSPLESDVEAPERHAGESLNPVFSSFSGARLSPR